MNKRLALIVLALAMSLLANCQAKPTPTPTPTPQPTATTPAVAPTEPPAPTEGWTVYEVPDERFAIALPPTWGNVDMNPANFQASLNAVQEKYPDVADLVQGEAIALINAGVAFFGFDPTSEALKAGGATDASVQRQRMGTGATLDQIRQLVQAQLENTESIQKPIHIQTTDLAAGGQALEVSFRANVTDRDGNPLELQVFQYLALNRTDLYVVTMSANADLAGRYAPVFRSIGRSLAFIPPRRYEVSLDDDPVKGSPDAPVTIVEFSEFQCPYCGYYSREVFPKIDEAYIKTGKVKYVFRDFPLSFHSNAQKAAEAAGCAGQQGKFWEYHDVLFAHQDALDIPSLKQYAADLGLDTAQFDACLDSGTMAKEVAGDAADGQTYGVSGTPAFFVNGIRLNGAQPFEAFQELIEEELAKK
ncbi:MAG: DsbA family protein [Anaerolineae bacterium]|nr:DsbA family protein [Anaerolineae bacterium]